MGFTSLRSFQEDLVARIGQDFSYTAARNYHDVDPRKGRMPPVEYLNAVSQAFRVRLEWLVRGEGAMLEAAARKDRRTQGRIELLRSAHREEVRSWPESALKSLLELQLYQVGANPALTDMETDLFRLVMFPLGAWGFRSLEELDESERFAYFNAVFTALFVAARKNLEGNRLDEYPDSLLPRVRRLLAGEDPDPSEKERRWYEERQTIMEDHLRTPPGETVPPF
jgi:hypothetical protein